ncbi:hypothetical protein RJT34_22079 [Clitoria ternatea]|uniref:Uncharacterized protein n=1 Tax=Clitoria ternatea TaxID=43366 RepID=A0AAN9IV84_CLITE
MKIRSVENLVMIFLQLDDLTFELFDRLIPQLQRGNIFCCPKFQNLSFVVANPVLITCGIEKTAKALVSELEQMSKETKGCGWVDYRLKTVLTEVEAASARNNDEVGNMIAEALRCENVQIAKARQDSLICLFLVEL